LPAGRQSKDTGSALLYVLWISVLLATLLAGAAGMVQMHLRQVAGVRDGFVRDEALRSALELVAFDVALAGRSFVASLPTTVRVDGQDVVVGLSPAHSRLDINMANDEQLRELFAYVGESESAALRLSDQILDWRDSDPRRRANGAEEPDYPPGLNKTVGNRNFIDVMELLQVRDMNRGRLACIAPYVTVLGGTPDPALEDLSYEQVEAVEGIRVGLLATRARADGSQDRLAGLAQFGRSRGRPFEWVSFAEEASIPGTCRTGAASQ
jgi:general secretion pathway protein K